MTTKARRRTEGARVGRPVSGLERVKFFVRAAPADVETFRAVRVALIEAEGSADARGAGIVHASFVRPVTDAEVFHLAVRALVASLPKRVRAQFERSRR
jgi:hypothetical protein